MAVNTSIVEGKRVAATAIGLFSLFPHQIWQVLTLPEGAGIFRVEHRQQLSNDGKGTWQEQVTFTAPVRILFWKKETKTCVHQEIDASNPECITVDFKLLNSDLMSHLTGSWQLKLLSAGSPTSPPCTKVTYSFEMWPKGVPSGLRFMPGLMDAVKGAVAREAGQLLDKVQYVAHKVRPGVSVAQAVREAAAEVAVSGGSFKLLQQALAQGSLSSSAAAAAVQCHALVEDDLEDSEDEESSDSDCSASPRSNASSGSSGGVIADVAVVVTSTGCDTAADAFGGKLQLKQQGPAAQQLCRSVVA